MSLQFSQHAATGELREAALAEKLFKLRWPPKARNAVKYYWGIPDEQVSTELAFSGGSQALTRKPIAQRQTHLQNLPLYPESSLTSTQVNGSFTNPARAGLVLLTQSHATLFLYFHSIFLLFSLCCLFLQAFSPVSFPHSINVQNWFLLKSHCF